MRVTVFVKTRRQQVIDSATAIYIAVLAFVLALHVLRVFTIPYVEYLSAWTALNAGVFIGNTLLMKNPIPIRRCPHSGCDELLDPRVSLRCPKHGEVAQRR